MSRNASERLLQIHRLLGAGKYPASESMAREFEVSQKTIKRDIAWMKDHWDAPIEFDRSRGGYFYTKPMDKIPGVPTVTEAEMFAMLVAHKAIEQYRATPFHEPLQRAFQKLVEQLDTKERYELRDFEPALSFKPFAPELPDTENSRQSRAACSIIAS